MNKIQKIILVISLILLSPKTEVFAQFDESQYLTVEVQTGEEVGSGSNMTINLKLVGSNNSDYQEDYISDISRYIDGNAFERNTTDKFNYLAAPFTELEKLVITPYKAALGIVSRDWYLKKIIITLANKNAYQFTCNCKLYTFRGPIELHAKKLNKFEPELNFYDMKVEVLTSDKSKAGTNANVYMTINSENGLGSPYKLNHRISGNAFERGDHDILHINHDYIQQIKFINIRHDNKGSGSGWHLEEIKITLPSGKVNTFECDCWMEGSENGRTLHPKGGIGRLESTYIQSSLAAKYLEVQGGRPTNDTPLQIWHRDKSRAQKFYIEPAGNNYYYIKSGLGEDNYLHIAGVSPNPEALVVLWGGKGGDNTKWRITEINNQGFYLIQSKLGTYLDVQWGSAKNGTPVWMWTKNAGRAQQWRFMYEGEDGTLYPKRFN